MEYQRENKMSKQLLIYGNAVPVHPEQHKDLSVKVGKDYAFANDINSVPLTAGEFPAAAAEYVIVFAGTEENIIPVALLGLREKENLFVSEDNQWNAQYIPAYIRRYPFIFTKREEENRFVLCIDEEFSGNNKEGLGERLFDAEGTQTQFTKGVLNFMQEYQTNFERTRLYCKKLKELDLLESVQIRMAANESGEEARMRGFMAISRTKLNALSGEQLEELAKTGELEMSYVHLQSLQNLNSIGSKVTGSKATDSKVNAPLAEAQDDTAAETTH